VVDLTALLRSSLGRRGAAAPARKTAARPAARKVAAKKAATSRKRA
jgi:hypothetical protein